MANVIPNEMRRDMRNHSRARFVLAGSTVALISAALSFLMFLPSYFALIVNSRGVSPDFTPITTAVRVSDGEAIQHTNALLSELAPIAAASSTPTDTIASALALRPSGVRVDQIIYTQGAPSSLMLEGSADTNGEISAYRSALAADSEFTSVSVPVGALVGTDGGRFSITLLGTF